METLGEREQFAEILEELGRTLDITKEQYEAAVKSYEYVGEWLSKEDSPLSLYRPEIVPQGSFMLRTMTKPVNEEDNLDIDLVCQFEGKQPEWTQFDLKNIVGDWLKSNGTIKKLLTIPDGRRCWTLQHADSARFHMDVLPAIVSTDYKTVLAKSMARSDIGEVDTLAIRITDKKQANYKTATQPEEWLKSNPFGYGIWFEQQASISFEKSILIRGALQPVPAYREDKLPLQRTIQILKRHRDIRFNGKEHKPISMIITTLAARAYRKETSITDALLNVIQRMPYEIKEKFSPEHGRIIKWIGNPVNEEENFADKWPEAPKKEENFFTWLGEVDRDVRNALKQRGMNKIAESLEIPFGENTIKKAFGNYGERLRIQRESGTMKMAERSGILGAVGRVSVPQHTNFGTNE